MFDGSVSSGEDHLGCLLKSFECDHRWRYVALPIQCGRVSMPCGRPFGLLVAPHVIVRLMATIQLWPFVLLHQYRTVLFSVGFQTLQASFQVSLIWNAKVWHLRQPCQSGRGCSHFCARGCRGNLLVVGVWSLGSLITPYHAILLICFGWIYTEAIVRTILFGAILHSVFMFLYLFFTSTLRTDWSLHFIQSTWWSLHRDLHCHRPSSMLSELTATFLRTKGMIWNFGATCNWSLSVVDMICFSVDTTCICIYDM